MKISDKSWHYKIYVFNSQLVAAWKDDKFYLNKPGNGKNIGLCPYMRMIFVWGPLAMLSYTVPIYAMYLALFKFPVSAAGAMGIVWLFGWIAGIIGFMFAMAWFTEYNNNRKANKASKSSIVNPYDGIEEESTFWTIIREYVVALKTKVCPILEVNND